MIGPALVTAAIAVFSAVLIGFSFVVTISARVDQFRSVFSRLCIQLREEQATEPQRTKFKKFGALIYPETDKLTALEFIEDGDRSDVILGKIDELALSLFGTRVIRLVLGGYIFGGIMGPGLSLVIYMLISDSSAKGYVDSWPVIAMVAAEAGAILSLLGCLLVWRVAFDWNLASLVRVVDRQPLWTPGRNRAPSGRDLVMASDDGAYKELRK